MLLLQELLRIQSFPDDYYLAGSQTDKKKFIGNAVPPVEALADILQQTGSRVTVSDCPGSEVDKTLTVSGPLSGVQAAHILLIRRVTDFLIESESRYVR
jgi:hypothetical protein